MHISNMDVIRKETQLQFNNQVSASVSGTSILMTHIDFQQCDEEKDSHFGNKHLQSKYEVLTPDHQTNGNVRLNGQMKNSVNSNQMVNGNDNHTASDNEGIPKPRCVIFAREKVHLEWKRMSKVGGGLVNIGNTCFLNSVLQCLTYCPPLVNFLIYNEEEDHQAKCKILGLCMACELQKHIKTAYRSYGDAFRPHSICNRLRAIAKHLTFGRQEDAHEFLRYLIDHMWKSCVSAYEMNNNCKLDAASKETTFVNQIFGGYHRSSVTCLNCNETSNTYDYFMDFMLDIKNVFSLDKALEQFVKPEMLQNENAYKCTKCKRKVSAKKQFSVYQAPNVATFQLKRFDFSRFIGKLTKKVSYPERLNLRPYMSDNKGPPIMYKLTSVLVHMGPTCNSGHYFCFVRNSNDFWYMMDDSRVQRVNLDHVLDQQAYLLFYVRVPDLKANHIKNNLIMSQSPSVIQTHIPIRQSELSQPSQNGNSKLVFQNGNSLSTPNKPTTLSFSPNKTPIAILKRPTVIAKPTVVQRPASSISKGLVPYAGGSSEDEDDEDDKCNGKKQGECDKAEKSDDFKAVTPKPLAHNSNEINKKPSQPSIPKQGNILNNLKLNGHVSVNHSLEANPLTPTMISSKVKATTPSSWHVSERENAGSPSIASNSSRDSITSTTGEWSVTKVDGKQLGIAKNKDDCKLKNKPVNSESSTNTATPLPLNHNKQNLVLNGLKLEDEDQVKLSVETKEKKAFSSSHVHVDSSNQTANKQIGRAHV